MRAGWMTLWSESDVCILYSRGGAVASIDRVLGDGQKRELAAEIGVESLKMRRSMC